MCLCLATPNKEESASRDPRAKALTDITSLTDKVGIRRLVAPSVILAKWTHLTF